jgi:hypothetical protein
LKKGGRQDKVSQEYRVTIEGQDCDGPLVTTMGLSRSKYGIEDSVETRGKREVEQAEGKTGTGEQENQRYGEGKREIAKHIRAIIEVIVHNSHGVRYEIQHLRLCIIGRRPWVARRIVRLVVVAGVVCVRIFKSKRGYL